MADPPSDPSDFGRCYRLLKLFPDWRPRLDEIAAKHPAWGPMVARWSDMEALWEEESIKPDRKAPKLFALMTTLVRQGEAAAAAPPSATGSAAPST